MAKQLNVDVNLNTAQAEAKLKNLQNLLSQAITSSSKSSAGGLTQEIVQATKAASELKVMLGQAMNPNTGNLDLSRFSQQLSKSKTSLNDYAKSLTKLGPQGQQAFMSLSKSIVSAEVPMRDTSKMLNEFGTTLKNTMRWQATSSLIHNLVGGIQSAMSYARGLDSSLNSIRIVTGASADEMNKFAKAANESAKALSASTLDYTDAALIYYQQGIRDQKQIKERTDATIKMANVTGDSAAKVSNQLTSIWNNFAKGGDNLEYYADVITALGAATASSSAEISAGLEKFASIAEETGLSYEYATSSLATIVATTRQSADVVGTALKTIFGRVQSLNLGETLEDGTTLGKYSKALSQVGIDIKDQNGQLKDMDMIIDEMGNKWQTLNRDQRVALAQAVAGARQYNQLMALMENYDFFKENVAIAKGSEGELTKQADIYAESWDAAKIRVRAAAQGIFDDLISDKFFIGFNDGLATALGGIDKFVDALGGIPGTLGLIGSIVTKVFSSQIGQSIERGIQSFKVFTGVARVEANSVREQAITAAKTFTPDETAPKSLQMQSSSLQQQLVLANQYQQKMEAIAKAGGQVAASDKQRIASLMQIVELTQEAAIAAQQQVEASEQAWSQTNADISRNMLAKGQSRKQVDKILNSLGEDKQLLENSRLATSAIDRFDKNNFNITQSQREGLTGILNQALLNNRSGLSQSKALDKDNINRENFITQYSQAVKKQEAALKLLASGGEYETIKKQYEQAQKKAKSYKGGDKSQAAALEAEANRFAEKLKQITNTIKDAVGNAAKSLGEEAEEAIIGKLKDETDKTRNDYINNILNNADTKVNAEDLENQGNAYLDETAEAIENLNKENFSGLTTGLTNAMSGVSNLAMGISSLQSGIQALNDESLSFGDKLLQVGMSFGMAVPMITSGIGSMATGLKGLKTHGAGLLSSAFLANTAAGFGESNAYRAALLAGTSDAFLMGEGSKGRLGKAIGGKREQRYFDKILKQQFKAGATRQEAIGAASLAYKNKYGKYIGSEAAAARATAVQSTGAAAGAAGGLSMLQVAGIVAALAALAVLVAKVKKELYDASLEGQLEKAAAEGQQLTSALEEAQSAAEGLKSAFDSYHGIADTLSKCTTGTQEWSEALRENNNEVLSLMSQYPELAKIQGAIQKNADGSLSISKEAEQEMNTIAQNRIDTLSWAKLANAETQQMLKDQLDIQAKGREMAQLMESGKDTGYWSKGEYIKEARTSAFDTDLFGAFYKTGTEGGISDLHPYEQTHETSVGANQLANEALIKNWGDLQALSGEQLTSALSDVFAKNNLGVSSDDLAKYSAAVESSTYRDELTKLYNQQKAAQEAFETSQIGVMSNKLASEGILDNDSKTRDLISNIFGKQLDERTKAAVEDDKQKYASSKSERQRLAEEYVAAMGGDINSISFNNSGELSYFDNAGQKIEGVTGAMVASVTGAASALDALAGSAEAAAGAMQAIPMTQGGDAIRDFLANEDFSKTSATDLREVLKNVVLDDEGTYDANVLSNNLIKAMGGIENAQEIAAMLGKELPDLIADMTTDLVNQNEWLNSAERAASIAAFEKRGVDRERLENYSRAELEARQNYEDSRFQGPVKSLQELQTMAEAAGEAQQYLNRSWEDGTRLSAEQAAGIKDIVQNQDLYNMAIDENTGKIKDAQLLQELLGNTIDDVGKQALRSQQPLYEQLDQAYKKLQENQLNPDDKGFLTRQENLLSELDLLDQEIAKYRELALVSSGALQAYDKIAKGKEYDEANDYTDELEGALGSIYSHIEKDSNGNYKWDTLQSGSREVQAAIEALIPEDVRTGKNREGITVQQYLRDMYGDGKVGGRYRDKDGNITKANVDNFVNDMLGKSSSWGTYSGFLEGREGYNAEDFYSQGFSKFLDGTKQGSRQQQGTIQEAAASMHMTESSFISMLSAAEKYNTSGESYLSQFTADGSDLAIQLQLATEQIKTSTEAAIEARKKMNESEKGSKEYQDAEKQYTKSIQEQTQAILEQKKAREQAHDVGAEYAALQKQLESSEGDSEAIAKRMAEIQAEHPEIEVYLSFVTDEANIQDIQQTIQEAMDSGAEGLGDLSADAWSGIADNIASSINQDGALDALFENFDFSQFEGDATKAINSIKTQLPQMFDAFDKKGLGNKLKDYITQAVEDASQETGETDLLGADSINGDELANAARDATQQAVDAAQEVADSNPIKLTYESEEDGKGDKGGTSSYTGSSTNDPKKEGFTEGATNKGGKVQSSGGNPKIKVELDTTEAQANLDAFVASISSIPASVPLTITSNLTNVADQVATLSGTLNILLGIAPTITITTNANAIGGQIQQLKTKALQLNGIKPRITISSNAAGVLGTVGSLRTALSQIKSPPPVHITITADPIPRLPGVVPPAFGTARAYGNAFAKGQWGTGTGPIPALVGELGQELIVDPANGKFYTVGDAGAEFITLPKNAIVFNHKQTEQLLKYRKINSRGQAMVNGNAYASGDNVEDVRNLIADIFERDSSLTTYRSNAAAAAEKERAEYEQKLVTILREEVDLYATIERTIKRTERHLQDFTRNLDRLYGDALINNYRQAINESRKLYEVNLKARDIASDIYKNDLKRGSNLTVQWQEKAAASYSTADKPAYNTNLATQNWSAFDLLTTYGNLDPSGITRGANGEVLDIDPTLVDLAIKTIQRRAEDNWNLSQDESKTQADRVAAENAANWFDGIVKTLSTWYQQVSDSEDKVAEYNDAAQDALEQTHDYAVELIRKEFEMRIKMQENELKLIDLKLKRLGDGFFKTAERMALAFDKNNAFDLSKNTVFTKNLIKADAAIKEYQDVKTDLENAKKDDRQAYAATQNAFMETTQEAFDELTNDLTEMIEKAEDQMNAWGEALEESRNVLSDYTDQLSHITTMLSHIEDILDLTGQKYNYQMKDTVLRSSVQSINNELGAETKYYEILKKNREEAEAHWLKTKETMSEEAAQAEYEKYVLPAIKAEQESLEKRTELYKDALSKIEEIWENSLAKIMSDWEETITNNEGFDWLSSSMQRAKSIQEEYLTTTNKIYETNTLMRKVQNDIDKTSNKLSKEKLANFNKEIEAAQNSEKLSKNSMEILKARYELLQAEMALEDAKNAKSTVRLQRDNEGNYGYVYTADQDDVDDAEQNLADKQNDLYNLVLGIQNDSQEQRLQVQQEYHAAAQQLYDDYYNKHLISEEEYNTKLAELKRQAEEQLVAIDGDITESAFWLNEVAAEGVSEAWTDSYDTRMAKTDEFMECFNDSSNQVSTVIADIDKLRDESSKRADIDLKNLDKDISTLTTTSDTLSQHIEGNVIPAIEKELDAVEAETQGFWDQHDAIMAAIDARKEYLDLMQADMNAVSGSMSKSAYDQDFSILDLQARLAGDHSGQNLVFRDQKIDLYNMKGSVQDSKNVGAINEYLSIHAAENDEAFIQKAASTLYRITKEDSVDFASLSDKEKDQYVFKNIANKSTSRMATGGYTGEWGPEGKIAILHEKELVLNKDDTSNFLKALEVAKENYMQFIQTQRLQSLYEQQMIASTEQFTSAAFQNNTDSLQQDVTIHAEFPNVTERNEIAEAFKTLVNEASQFANRY